VTDYDDLAEWFAEQQSRRQRFRAGALAFGIAAVPLLAILAAALLLPSPQSDDVTTQTAGAPVRTAAGAGQVEPTANWQQPATTRRQPAPATRKQERPPEVTGYVLDVRAVGVNESLFWGVPEGLGAVTLATSADGDRADFICVFPGGAPDLKAGRLVRVAGKPGKTTPGGAKVYTDCELRR
jgi:hypothetical protein